MSREMKGLFRFAMEQSDGTTESAIDPEKTAWLRNALASSTIDLVSRLKENIQMLNNLLNASEAFNDEAEYILEDILSLTEDINLANDFFKVGGGDLLHTLLHTETLFKPAVLTLIANLTQNNPFTQEICLERNVLQYLLELLPREQDFECLKKLIMAISCMVRGFEPAISIFLKVNGFNIILDILDKFVNLPEKEQSQMTRNVCTKSTFTIYCLLQESLPDRLGENVDKQLAERLARCCIQLIEADEFLLGALILLLTNQSSIEDAIDVENQPQIRKARVRSLMSQPTIDAFQPWLRAQDERLRNLTDDAQAELRSYLGVLVQLLKC